MFVLELADHPGYYAHKNSGTNTLEQHEDIDGKISNAWNYTNIIANAKVHATRTKAETELKKILKACASYHRMTGPNINIVEIFIVSEREFDENPILKKAFDDFRLARRLSTR